ncbi:MAG: TldD/PmbA family protein [Candidatus Woesearchaeota archaeon]
MTPESFISFVDEINEFLSRKVRFDYSINASYRKKSGVEINNGKVSETLFGSNYGLGIRIITSQKEYLISLNNFYNWKQKLYSEIEKIRGKEIEYFISSYKKEIYFGNDVFKEPSFKDLKDLATLDLKEDYHSKTSYSGELNIFASRNSRILQYFPRSVFALEVFSKKIQDYGFKKDAKISYIDKLNVEKTKEDALKQMKDLEIAKPFSGGKYDVLSNSILTGVFIHEALGHASESDLVYKEESCLKGKLNQKIAAENVNVYDSALGLDDYLWGTFAYDDEGIIAQRTQIIHNGVLKNYLVSLRMYHKFAKNLGLKPTGNSRIGNYNEFPLVRMTNTYIEKGNYSKEELFEELRNGIYMVDSRGGQVNTATGSFQFKSALGYVVKNGKILYPIKGTSLKGNILETLNNIVAIGKEYGEDSSGTCGKNSASVPVGGKNPEIIIKSAIVGGTDD